MKHKIRKMKDKLEKRVTFLYYYTRFILSGKKSRHWRSLAKEAYYAMTIVPGEEDI